MQVITSETQLSDLLEKSSDLPLFINFTAKWCGPCKAIKSWVTELAKENSSHMISVVCDIDIAEDLADLFKIQSVPTFVLWHDNKVIGKTVGANKDNIVELVQKLY